MSRSVKLDAEGRETYEGDRQIPPHCPEDDPCIWCREESLKSKVEELTHDNEDLRAEVDRMTREIADLRRRIGEWADRMTQRHGMSGGMVDQTREEAGRG